MATLRMIPKDLEAKNNLGGDCFASEWLNTQSGNPATVLGKGKNNTITFKLAVGGNFTSPQWSEEYSLPTTGGNVKAQDLQNAINAGLTFRGFNIVLVSCDSSGSGTEDFYTVVNGKNENYYPPVNE